MPTNQELDLLFSPRKWTKRGPSEKIIGMHIEFITKVKDIVRNKIPCQLNISYGVSQEESLDIYGTDLPPDAPIFVYIHGGYWQQLNKNISNYPAESLHKKGIKVIVLGYTLCPNCSLNNIVEEIENGISKCLEYAKKCGSRGLYLCGHSAGAHLIACLFREYFKSLPDQDQKYLKGVYFISGVYDLVPIVQTYINDALKLTEKVAKYLSPIHQTFQANNDIKFFVIVGEYESPAFYEQAKAFYEKLRTLGSAVEFIEIQGVDHFNIVENLCNSGYELVNLITNMLNKE